MKKNNKNAKSPTRSKTIRKSDQITIGMDLGDKTSQCCLLNASGDVLAEQACATTKRLHGADVQAMRRYRIAIDGRPFAVEQAGN